MKQIVVLGSLNADLIFYVPRVPVAGETISGGEFLSAPGGKGLNQAVACAKLSPAQAQVCMLGGFGDDPNSIMLRRALQGARVDVSLLKAVSAPSGTALIQVVQSTGENRIVICAGANGMVTPELVDADDWSDSIMSAAGLLMQLELSIDTVVRAAELANSRGVPVFLNAAPAHPLPMKLYSLVDYLFVNEIEAETYTGIKVDTCHAAAEACEVFQKYGVRQAVILTRGGEGSTVLDAKTGSIYNIPAAEVQVVDTTGAGDAFIGAFVARVLSGDSIRKASEYASVAGSLAVERAGAADSIPNPEEVNDAFMRWSRKVKGYGGSERDTDSE